MKTSMMTVLVLSVLTAAALAQSPRVPLKTKLPKLAFEGTPPASLKSDNLEKIFDPKGKRPPLMVPKDVKNVALDKDVKSSDMYPNIGELENITDGDKEAASYVELAPMKQYVQIDLEKKYEIHAIVVWHNHEKARIYKDVVIQVADDEDFIKNVRTVFNNDHDNSAGLGVGKDKEWIQSLYGRPISVSGESARYVRLYSNGSVFAEGNHYTEVEVFAK